MNQPEVTTCPALKGNWVLTEDFTCLGVNIPKGFLTDLASIPRFLWRIIAPFELSLASPVFHDWAYRHKGIIVVNGEVRIFTREAVDNFFRSLMEKEGVAGWRIALAYRGVRMFGGFSWGKSEARILTAEKMEEIL